MKNRRPGKGFIIFLILVFLILLGLFRIYLFVNINNQLKENLHAPTFLYKNQIELIRHLDSGRLVILKWALTIVFTLVYLGISCWTVKWFFHEWIFVRITLVVFFLMVLISFFVMMLGYFYPGIAGEAYQFSRYLMGIAQSPLVLMILIPLFKVSAGFNKNN